MTETFTTGKAYVIYSRTTPSILNSRLKFASGSSDWGVLTYNEISERDNYINVDVLRDSDDSVLISGLIGIPTGRGFEKAIDLSRYAVIGSNNIKLQFNFYILDQCPILRNVSLIPHQKW